MKIEKGYIYIMQLSEQKDIVKIGKTSDHPYHRADTLSKNTAAISSFTPNPDAAAAGRKAGMASRQNTIFSISMLFFMVYKAHGPHATKILTSGEMATYWIVALVLIGVMELNALGLLPWKANVNKGLNKMYDGPGVRNALVTAFGLWVVFLVLTEVLFKV